MGSTAPASVEIEGHAPFSIPGIEQECFTWYKIHGDLKSDITPLIVIHGGPGLSHDYLRSLSALTTNYAIPVIFYDQIGNGRSTHLPQTAGDESFWVESLFHAELANLITHLGLDTSATGYSLLGHSWGGMMGSTFAGSSPPPKNLRKLIIGNAPANIPTWDAAYHRYLDAMPADIQAAIKEGEAKKEYDSKEYEAAVHAFMEKHCCTATPWPEEFAVSFGWAEKDPTVGETMGGKSEFTSAGSLMHWTAEGRIGGITVRTLVINGCNEGACDEAVKPFVEGIKVEGKGGKKGVRWVKFEKSTHMPIYEETEKYLKVVGEWLLEE